MTLRNYLWLHYKALPPAVTSFTFTNNQETRMLICLCARVHECVAFTHMLENRVLCYCGKLNNKAAL